MKKNLAAIAAATLCLLPAACSNDQEPGVEDKTPIAIGTLAVQDITIDTRATAVDFFEDNDEITVTASPIAAGVPYTGTAKWSDANNRFGSLTPVLYLEDVYKNGAATHTFELTFGRFEGDQSSEAAHHRADMLKGTATLDLSGGLSNPVLSAPSLQRQGVKVEVIITQGNSWANQTDFENNLKGYKFIFLMKGGVDIIPYQFGIGNIEQHAIIPPDKVPASGGTLFKLEHPTTKRIINCTYTLPAGSVITAGTRIIVSVPFDNTDNGIFSEPTITVTGWQKEGPTELPGKI